MNPLTNKDLLTYKIHLIEQLRAHKEILKQDIQKLLEQIQQDDIQIRDIRQSLGMTLEEAKSILEKYTKEDYSKAREIYNAVNNAKKIIEEMNHG